MGNPPRPAARLASERDAAAIRRKLDLRVSGMVLPLLCPLKSYEEIEEKLQCSSLLIGVRFHRVRRYA